MDEETKPTIITLLISLGKICYSDTVPDEDVEPENVRWSLDSSYYSASSHIGMGAIETRGNLRMAL